MDEAPWIKAQPISTDITLHNILCFTDLPVLLPNWVVPFIVEYKRCLVQLVQFAVFVWTELSSTADATCSSSHRSEIPSDGYTVLTRMSLYEKDIWNQLK